MLHLDPNHVEKLEPEKKPSTTLTPSLVMKDRKPYMVFGTPGGDNQDQWTLQFFLNHVDFGMNIQQAVSARRFHHQWRPDRLYLEPDFAPDVQRRLEGWGHPVFRSERPWSSAQGIVRDRETGIFWGGSDPRSDGRAVGY